MFLNVRRFCFSLVILLGIFLSINSRVGNAQEDDIRIDVPADGRVHVENRYGDVDAEVWDKPYV